MADSSALWESVPFDSRRWPRRGRSLWAFTPGNPSPSPKVVAAEKVSSGGLQKKLVMTIAVPLLWGVPPASGTLCVAVRSGVGRYCRKDISAVELFCKLQTVYREHQQSTGDVMYK
ncbi:unnamed protein product [Musa acuminata var. zebrina]